MKKTYGLIGFPLIHSFSQKYFTEKFSSENISDCEFKNFSVEYVSEFKNLISQHPNLLGLSVTIPHKETIIPLLDMLDSSAKNVGAVNCVKRQKSEMGKWVTTGFNTDIFGFEKSLKPLLKSHHTHALILGTGGASKAVAYVLDMFKIKFRYISRYNNKKNLLSKILSYEELSQDIISESAIIINTTPLGMFPNVNTCPDIPYEHLSSKHLLYDLNYNPQETLFLKKGTEKGAEIKNGLEMLHFQAEQAWEIWNS